MELQRVRHGLLSEQQQRSKKLVIPRLDVNDLCSKHNEQVEKKKKTKKSPAN